MINNGIIPSIETMKNFELFLISDYKYCIIMNFHISLLADLVLRAHNSHKKVFVHIDLIHGLTNDEYGSEYLCQKLNVDGLISTKRKCLETAKRCHKQSILRLFLIDSKSLNNGLNLANKLQPDYLEILPAIATSIIPYIKSHTNVALIGGGLLTSQEAIQLAILSGLEAVSLSNNKLWFSNTND